ncbi:hypothetical protein E2320_012780 [Naja naja]|nr:hypothetical protein E2320_012780 [Naja naja]
MNFCPISASSDPPGTRSAASPDSQPKNPSIVFLGAGGRWDSGERFGFTLVQKLKTEKENIQELILDTLTGCLRVEAFEALATGSVSILKEKLRDPSQAIRCKAAEALMAISVPLEGKNMVFKENVFPDLVSLLEDNDSEVRANAAGALMNSAVTTQVRLYSIKALTMLSEAPEGRLVLLKHVPEFRKHLNDSNATVQRAAQIAIQVIEWKP